MAGKRSNSVAKQKSTKKLKLSLRKAVLDQVCAQLDNVTEKNKGRKPYGHVAKLVNDMKQDYPWITRHTVNYAFELYKRASSKEKNASVESAIDSSDTESGVACRNKGGRPRGSTDNAKFEREEAIRLAQDSMAIEYDEKRKEAKRIGRKVENGCLEKIVKKWKRKYNLDDSVIIKKETIRSRSYNNKLIVKSFGPQSPMADVEPVLVDLIIKMSRIRRCLTPTQCLHLANDLIRGTDIEKNVIKFKEDRYHQQYTSASLGLSYWNGFKTRWGHKLSSKRGQKFALDRSSATTFTNINKMYSEVYEAMVECGAASKLDTAVYMDRDGSIVSNKVESFGMKVTHSLDNPHISLVVDEVGSNLSQKGDGHIGGQKYICEKGCVPQVKVQHSERHFTLLGFTALDGSPVLCLIIISGVREHLNLETGIDVTKPIEGDITDKDFIDANFGKGKLFPGGPTCHFQGKEIPCMVRWSPKGGITSKILADALAHIDSFDVFPRSNGKYPFLLLEGHNSRFEIPFLEYVTNDAHQWMVCIGVPYGTAIWQVADSKEQNGSYKIALARAKKVMLERKLSLFMKNPSLVPTDIIPLVNIAWDLSFQRVPQNRKAIAERGWGPLNRNLLLYKEIQDTMTKSERETFAEHIITSPPMNSVDISTDNSTISDLTNLNLSQTQQPKILNLNYSSGNSAMVLETYVHESDLREARERNRIKKSKGEEMQKSFSDIKSVTAMYHFNELGCMVGMDALKKKRQILTIHEEKLLQQRQKEEADFNDKKKKFDEVMALNLPDDKLTGTQLKILCNVMKRKTDKPISSLKKQELLTLWKEWKSRPVPLCPQNHNMIASVNEMSTDTTVTCTTQQAEIETKDVRIQEV